MSFMSHSVSKAREADLPLSAPSSNGMPQSVQTPSRFQLDSAILGNAKGNHFVLDYVSRLAISKGYSYHRMDKRAWLKSLRRSPYPSRVGEEKKRKEKRTEFTLMGIEPKIFLSSSPFT